MVAIIVVLIIVKHYTNCNSNSSNNENKKRNENKNKIKKIKIRLKVKNQNNNTRKNSKNYGNNDAIIARSNNSQPIASFKRSKFNCYRNNNDSDRNNRNKIYKQ